MENPLALWRDLSIVWLILLALIPLAVLLVVFYLAQLYLRRFRRWLRLPLLHAQVWALRIEQGTARASARVANVPIGLRSAGVRAEVTARGVLHFLRGK